MIHSLANKYYILGALVPDVPALLTRGKILGPVAAEESGIYLCETYAIEPADLTIRNQCLIHVSQLAKPDVLLYDDRELWDVEFRMIVERVKNRQPEITPMMTARAEARKRGWTG